MIGARAVTGCLIGLAVAAGAARAPVDAKVSIAQTPVRRVLVMPFSVHAEAGAPGGAAAARWLGEAAATLTADELTALGLPALPREGRVAVFDRLQMPMTSELTRASVIRIGELIGASEVVYGDVRVGSVLTVRARTIQIETARQWPDVTHAGTLGDIFPLFAQVADDIVRLTGRSVPAEAVRPVPLPLPVLENYIKGLMAVTSAAQQRFLEAAMMQAPRDGRVLNALWGVYADQGLHDKALSAASAVPADSPYARRARFNVALSLVELRRLDGAFKELTTLHGQERSGAVSNALGVVQLRRGILAESPVAAPVFFERAANESPGQIDYLFNLGYARALAGDVAGALLWLREVVRHDVGDGDAHLVMAALLASAGRSAEAQRELDLARLLGTSLDEVPATLTQVPPALERLRPAIDDNVPGASAFTAPAQRDQLETARFHLEQARKLIAERQDREALAQLRRSIYLAPYEDEPHLLLGRLYQRTGRLSEAIGEYKVALWCRETAEARIALGSALVESGQREAARQEFERALVLAPHSPEAREWLARIGG